MADHDIVCKHGACMKPAKVIAKRAAWTEGNGKAVIHPERFRFRCEAGHETEDDGVGPSGVPPKGEPQWIAV